MLTVRELKALAARLDAAAFAKQLGPFVLVERPFTKERKSGSLDLTPKTTRPLKGARSNKGVLDFDDLWVATLPPLRDDDEVLIVGDAAAAARRRRGAHRAHRRL